MEDLRLFTGQRGVGERSAGAGAASRGRALETLADAAATAQGVATLGLQAATGLIREGRMLEDARALGRWTRAA